MSEEQQIPQGEMGQSKPQPTWFFERGDGKVFAVNEKEAWNILNNQSNWARRDFKLIGQSDGQIYFDTLKNSKKEANELLEQRAKLKVDLKKYLKTEDRLRFQELKDDEDEMVIKVTGILDKLNKQIAEIDEKLANFNKTIVDKAFELELERARGNIVAPSNQDIITPRDSDREKVLNMLGR